tara:strand:- start:441 stop:791 length:351 start_codon:yes stop_codon:yes gene_type:complete
LDGGRSWAVIQLLTLKDRYGNHNGHEILRKFDLVIANSGGSIVLAALAEDYSIYKAITLFQNKKNREQMFHKNTFKDRYFSVDYLGLLNADFDPKYSTTKKRRLLRTFFLRLIKCK